MNLFEHLDSFVSDVHASFSLVTITEIPQILQHLDTKWTEKKFLRSARLLAALEVLKRLFPSQTEIQLFVTVKHYFDTHYAFPGQFPWPAVYYKVGADVCAIELDNPELFVIRPGFDYDDPTTSFLETVKGVPRYLLEALDLEQKDTLVKFIKEAQIHMARLSSLGEFQTGDPWIAMVQDELQTAVLKALVSNHGYSLAHWHAVHAAEKLLKAFVVAHKQGVGCRVAGNPLSTNSHDIEKICDAVEQATGIVVPNSLIDQTTHVHNLRYKAEGTFEAAFGAQLKTMRLVSWAYPTLLSYLGYSPLYIGKEKLAKYGDDLLCRLDYPGLATPEDWQAPSIGVYGTPFTIEVLEELAEERRKRSPS